MVCALAAVAVLCGCSDDEDNRTPGAVTATTTAGPGSGGSGGSGGGSGGDAHGGFGGSPECVSATLDPVVLFDTNAPALGELTTAGTRLATAGDDGLMLMDGDGQNVFGPTMVSDFRHEIVSTGDGVAVAVEDASWLYVRRFDAQGDSDDTLAGVMQGSAQVFSVGSASWGAPVVWASGFRLMGRTRYEFTMSDEYVVMSSAFTNTVEIELATLNDEVGVVWNGAESPGLNQIWFTRVTSAGPTGDRVLVYEDDHASNLIDVTALSDGYAVLISGGEDDDPAPVVVRLDASGSPQGSPTRLRGSDWGLGLATNGNSILAVGGRAGETQVRAFDTDLSPTGEWTCLGEDFQFYPGVGVTAFGEGFAMLLPTEANRLLLYQINATGDGVQ